MAFADAIQTVFRADSTLLSYVISANVFTYDNTKRNGISLNDTPTAYDANGILLPCIVIKDRSQVPDGGIADDVNQIISTRHIVEIWFYNSGNSGYSTIENMRKRVFALLQGNQVSNCLLRINNNILSRRDPSMAQAAWERSDYTIFTFEP